MENRININQKLNRLEADIVREAKQKADKIMQDAKSSIENIKNALDEQRTFLQEHRFTQINEELEHELMDVKGELARSSASALLAYKQEMLGKIITEILSSFRQKMLQDADFYYKTYLTRLINETLDLVMFKEYYIMLNSRDKAYIKKHPDFLQGFQKKIHVMDETFSDDDIGCIIEDKQGNVKIDQRLSKKIESNERFLRTKLSPLLFEGV